LTLPPVTGLTAPLGLPAPGVGVVAPGLTVVVPEALVEPLAPALVPPVDPLAEPPVVAVPPAPKAKAQPRMVAAVTAEMRLRFVFMMIPFYSSGSLFPTKGRKLIIF